MAAVHYREFRLFLFQVVLLLVLFYGECRYRRKGARYHYDSKRTTLNPYTKTICMQMDDTLRARHKTCFLRPDTGPCRADILQWYFDGKQKKCYRFFWGGCQGNGNRFETKDDCMKYCHLNTTHPQVKVPYFCSLGFDFGTCFGHFNRWGWDKFAKTCKRRLYSGCGGNQNNFESQDECMRTCLTAPNNTVLRFRQFTTCVPFNIAELQ